MLHCFQIYNKMFAICKVPVKLPGWYPVLKGVRLHFFHQKRQVVAGAVFFCRLPKFE
jgi:hypothetical protein